MSYNNGEFTPFFEDTDEPLFLNEYDFDFDLNLPFDTLGSNLHIDKPDQFAAEEDVNRPLEQFENVEWTSDLDLNMIDETDFDFFIDDLPHTPNENGDAIIGNLMEEIVQNVVDNSQPPATNLDELRREQYLKRLKERQSNNIEEMQRRERIHNEYLLQKNREIFKQINKNETCDILDESIGILDDDMKRKYEMTYEHT